MTDEPMPDRSDDDEAAGSQQPEIDPPKHDDEVDDAAADSFPASDPPSFTGSSTTEPAPESH